MLIPIEAIREAPTRTAAHLHRTPVFSSRTIGERANARVRLKCESFQKTGSFKPRGALNIVLSLPPERRARGLVTVSAGNPAPAGGWGAPAGGGPRTGRLPADAPRPQRRPVP